MNDTLSRIRGQMAAAICDQRGQAPDVPNMIEALEDIDSAINAVPSLAAFFANAAAYNAAEAKLRSRANDRELRKASFDLQDGALAFARSLKEEEHGDN